MGEQREDQVARLRVVDLLKNFDTRTRPRKPRTAMPASRPTIAALAPAEAERPRVPPPGPSHAQHAPIAVKVSAAL